MPAPLQHHNTIEARPRSISERGNNFDVDLNLDVEKKDDTVDAVEVAPKEILHRTLNSRHASMLALGGAIGTGLIIGSGAGLANAGPVGLLLAFIYVGTLCYAMMCALGEMAAFLPHQRGFAGHANRFVGPAFGAATGFAYWIKYLLGTPTQISAIAVIINFWLPTTRVNNAVWITIALLSTGSLQFMPVRYFGEFEFWCSTFKVITLTGLMILSLVIDAGGGPSREYIGFKNWKELPFVEYLVKGDLGRFLGFVSALITATYSYTSSEMVGVALGEMRNPRRNVARAVKACFYRIVFLYCGSIFCVGLVVPANSPQLLAANSQSTNANASPFVVAVTAAGIRVLPHIINSAALVFVISAANSDVYINSRTAFALASDGHLPKVFLRTNKHGVPYVSVLATLIVSSIAYTAATSSAYTIFKYFVSAVTMTSTIVWMSIMYTHIRFVRACKLNGIKREDLPYYTKLNPYLSWWGLIGTGVVSVTKGFSAFVGTFNATSFVTNYIALPVVVIIYLIFAFKNQSFITPLKDIDLKTGVKFYDENETDDDERAKPSKKRDVWGWIKFAWSS